MGYISNSPWNHAKIISRIYWYPINNRESDLLLTYVIVYSPCIHHQSMFFFFFFRNLNWRYTVIRPKCLGISDTKYGLKNGTLHLCFRVYSPSNPSSQWGNTSRKTWWVSKQTKIKMLGDFPRFTRFSTFSGWFSPWIHQHFQDQVYILLTCLIGLSICYTGIWAQSLISATSFLASRVVENMIWLVVSDMLYFSIIYGIILPIYSYFSEGWLNHQAVNSVQNPGWLMISPGILLANILEIMKIQEREIPFLTNQYNGKTKGFWTLLIENTKMV